MMSVLPMRAFISAESCGGTTGNLELRSDQRLPFAHWNSEQNLKTFLRAHRNAVPSCHKSVKRTDLPRLPRLLFEQELDHGGKSKGVAALEAFDRVEDQRRVEGRHPCTPASVITN